MMIVKGQIWSARGGSDKLAAVLGVAVDGEITYECGGHEYKASSHAFVTEWDLYKGAAVAMPTLSSALNGADANPKQRFGDKKCALHLVPPALAIGASVAFKEGAATYGPFNWRHTKVEAMTYLGAILRHAAAYMDGEDIDPESKVGKLHLEGIAANIGILLDATQGGFLIDNRPPKGPAPRLILTPKDDPK